MKLSLLVLVGIVASSSFAESAYDAVEEIKRIGREINNEKKQLTSGNLASLRWQQAADQRTLDLLEVYRRESFDYDRNWYDRLSFGLRRSMESRKQQIQLREEYIQEFGREPKAPCEHFFDLAPHDAELLRLSALNCISEMPDKYPAAWARLKANVPLVEFSGQAPPPREALYRAFVEAGVIAPPPAPAPIPNPTSAPTETPAEEQIRRFTEPESSAPTPRFDVPPLRSMDSVPAVAQPVAPPVFFNNNPSPTTTATPQTEQSAFQRVVTGVSNVVKLVLGIVIVILLSNVFLGLAKPLKWVLPKLVWLQLTVLQLTLSNDSTLRKGLSRLLVRLVPKESRDAAAKEFGVAGQLPDKGV